MWLLVSGCLGEPGGATDPQVERPPVAVVSPPAAPVPTSPGEPSPALSASNCSDVADGGPVIGPGCITGALSCGDTILGHTAGGTRVFDTRFYEAKHCTPATTRHDDGHERVYALTLPEGDHRAEVILDTPCADLDLAAIRVPSLEACPTVDTPISQCEMWPKPGDRRERVELVSQGPTTWLVVVEGKTATDAAFGLTVRCIDGI